MGFYRLKMKNILIEERIVDTGVVNDVTCTRQSVIVEGLYNNNSSYSALQ